MFIELVQNSAERRVSRRLHLFAAACAKVACAHNADSFTPPSHASLSYLPSFLGVRTSVLRCSSSVVPRHPPENVPGHLQHRSPCLRRVTDHRRCVSSSFSFLGAQDDAGRSRHLPAHHSLLSLLPITSPLLIMKNLKIIGTSVTLLSMIAPSAFAAETIVTMNQPDNGFYEGPNPEWATLHSTDNRGTTEHREYHRDGVRSHILWHEENISGRNTGAYEEDHRIFHQDRNMLHRQFHTEPVTPLEPSADQVGTSPRVITVALNTSVSPTPQPTSAGRPSRRSIVAAAEVQNSQRAILQ